MNNISEELAQLARRSVNGSVRANGFRGPSFLEHAYKECRSRERQSGNLYRTSASTFKPQTEPRNTNSAASA